MRVAHFGALGVRLSGLSKDGTQAGTTLGRIDTTGMRRLVSASAVDPRHARHVRHLASWTLAQDHVLSARLRPYVPLSLLSLLAFPLFI